MSYFTLVWSGIWRKKTRTILTMLSIVTAFLLFGLLQGINSGFDSVAGNLNANRLYSQNRYSSVEGMPVSYGNQIASVNGVIGVTHLAYFGGFYQEKRNSIGVFATDVPKLFELYKEYRLPPEQMDAMRAIRTGAVISRNLSAQYGWKVGDTVSLGTSIWTQKNGRNDYQFQVVGVFDLEGLGGAGAGQNSFYINYDYFDEARRYGTGRADFFIIGIDDPRRATETSKRIDELFANSSDEIKTESEHAFLGNQLKQLADINFIVNAIVGAVLATLLFLTGNTMMQSIRERVPELAVLKTLGFTDGLVSMLILCESLFLCVLSALVGLGLAWVAFQPIGDVFGSMQFRPVVIYAGVGIAVVLGVVAGGLPALRAKRLNIVDALAGR